MDKILSICLLMMTGATLLSCKTTPNRGETPYLRVDTTKAKEVALSETIWFTTSTEPTENTTIEPRVNGYLESVQYRSGAPIHKGDEIFSIDPAQISTAYYAAVAAHESAQATLTEAENNYKRAVPLAQIDAISRTSLDEYTANYAAAKADLKSAEEGLRNAELNLSYTIIKSPINGLIANSSAAVGDYVGPGTKFTTLTTISNIDTLKVALAIPTARYLKYVDNKLSYNNSELLSDMTLILADSSEYRYKAIYDYTQKDITDGSSTIVIYANVPNLEWSLKPNMFVRVRAKIGKAIERIIVPQKAVTQMQGVSSIWVIGNDSIASFRVVEVGSTFGNDWHIKSGLRAGETVATSAQLKLHEGMKVIPTKSSDNK